MTAESEITSMLSHATNNALSLASSSASLVNAAIATLDQIVEFPITPPYSPQSHGLENFDELHFDQTEPPLTFPSWPLLNFGDIPDTQDLDEVSWKGGRVALEPLQLPAFNYPPIAAVAGFGTGVTQNVATFGKTKFQDLLSTNRYDAIPWVNYTPASGVNAPVIRDYLPNLPSIKQGDTYVTLPSNNSPLVSGGFSLPGGGGGAGELAILLALLGIGGGFLLGRRKRKKKQKYKKRRRRYV